MNEPRKHPDVFTPEEAAEYLRLDTVRTLDILRSNFGLIAHNTFGKSLRYMRKDLDSVLLRMTGEVTERRQVRLAQ